MEHKVFGCRVNKYFFDKWYWHLGPKAKSNEVLVATCVVTDRAKKKWIKEVKKYLEEGKRVYLT